MEFDNVYDDPLVVRSLEIIARFLNTAIDSLGDPICNIDDLDNLAERLKGLGLLTADVGDGFVEVYTCERGYKESLVTASPFQYAAILAWGKYLDKPIH